MSDLGELILRAWDFSDPAGSGARFATAAAVLRTQQARACGLAGEFAEGHAILDSIVDSSVETETRIALERGRLLRSGGDVEASADLFRKAFELAQEPGLKADAAHMLALVLPQEQARWTERGLEAAAGSTDPLALGMTGALLNNRGWELADAKRWDEAYELFDRAVGVRQSLFDRLGGAAAANSLHVARWTRARANRALGRREQALAELTELAATEIGAADPYVTEELEALAE
jgi:tetratricopeptide (TPR) repeat protein